jgi:DNA-binding transcriptional LysR family regulator
MNKMATPRLPLDGDLLRSFAAVAETGSMTRASAAVGRTQSAVSLQMQRLESLVGQRLFDRQPRGVRLTPSGERLLGRVRQLLALIDQTSAELAGDALEGQVRIGIPEEYGSTLLPAVLARFADAQPRVQVTVACESSPSLERALLSGALDLAVLVIDSGRGEGELLGHDPTVWVASRTHDVERQDPLPVAMFDEDCWWRVWALRALDARDRRYRVAYTSRSVAGLQAAVMSGLAVAVLARSTMPDGCRILGARDGFEELPASRIVLRRAADMPTPPVEGMARAIRDSFLTALQA